MRSFYHRRAHAPLRTLSLVPLALLVRPNRHTTMPCEGYHSAPVAPFPSSPGGRSLQTPMFRERAVLHQMNGGELHPDTPGPADTGAGHLTDKGSFYGVLQLTSRVTIHTGVVPVELGLLPHQVWWSCSMHAIVKGWLEAVEKRPC